MRFPGVQPRPQLPGNRAAAVLAADWSPPASTTARQTDCPLRWWVV